MSNYKTAAEYAGRYIDEATNSTIVLEIDPNHDDGPEIWVSRDVVRGFDVLENYLLNNNLHCRAPSTTPLVRLLRQLTEDLSTGKRQS
ncbi:hypothetical protein PpBr36_04072 [Pyricularia pennisetigena]|uniref:hypothetical protein n=1 Tax=Pyricularia pennisetigena TaxID=1578925 RepID=UPI001151E37A